MGITTESVRMLSETLAGHAAAIEGARVGKPRQSRIARVAWGGCIAARIFSRWPGAEKPADAQVMLQFRINPHWDVGVGAHYTERFLDSSELVNQYVGHQGVLVFAYSL